MLGQAKLTNVQVVSLALFLEGGTLTRVDTEHVAMRTQQIAPGRFSWRHFPEQVNLEEVRKRLTDATRPDHGRLVSGSQRGGWQLTEAGVAFAEETLPNVDQLNLARESVDQKTRNWRNGERPRLLASDAYRLYLTGGISAVTLKSLEDFFRLNDYIQGADRHGRIERVLSAFRSDEELGRAVLALAEEIRRLENT